MPDDRQVNDVLVYRDSAGFYRERPIDPQVDSLAAALANKADVTALAAKADASAIPLPASATPKAEMTGGAKGSGTTRYALEDHQHPRLTSTTQVTVAAGATATVAFTRTFTNKPGVVCTEIEGDTTATAQPAIFKVQSWVQDANGLYTGCVVRIWRSQTVPTNLVSLLLGGVFNLFQTSVVGTMFSVVAIARSDVAST